MPKQPDKLDFFQNGTDSPVYGTMHKSTNGTGHSMAAPTCEMNIDFNHKCTISDSMDNQFIHYMGQKAGEWKETVVKGNGKKKKGY